MRKSGRLRAGLGHRKLTPIVGRLYGYGWGFEAYPSPVMDDRPFNIMPRPGPPLLAGGESSNFFTQSLVLGIYHC